MILEMRTYVLKPGMTNNFVERFAEGLTARLQFSKLLGLWLSEVGGLNRVVHVWPYESFEDRERIGGEARKTGKWPPKTQEFIITQENKFIQPAPFSPSLPERKLAEIYEFRTYTYQPGTMPTVLERTKSQNASVPADNRCTRSDDERESSAASLLVCYAREASKELRCCAC